MAQGDGKIESETEPEPQGESGQPSGLLKSVEATSAAAQSATRRTRAAGLTRFVIPDGVLGACLLAI